MRRRIFEIVPGASVWIVLLGLVLLSWRAPVFVAIFIILYDFHWILKTIYLSIHLRIAFARMRKNLKVDWLERVRETGRPWEDIYHLVVLPMYKEPLDLVRDSVRSLLDAHYPKENLLVVLALEERGGDEDQVTGSKILEEFSGVFGGFLVTTHPKGLHGEIPGKGSNETWATQRAIEKLIRPRDIFVERTLVSVFDIDTRPGKEYFGILTYHFLTADHPTRSSYQPIPLFTNNIHDVPALARLIGFSASFWQFMQQAREERLTTFSSHSMPLKALIEVGFWNTDIVSEDSRIFFQCLNHYNGDWRTVPLHYPIYMDAVSGSGFVNAMRNLYKQQRRWAWGVENFVYILENFWPNKRLTLKKKMFWTASLLDGFLTWSTGSFIIFLFGWLPNVFGGNAFYLTVLSYNLPRVTGVLLNLALIGIIASAILSFSFLPPRVSLGRKRHLYLIWYFLQWALVPVTFICFSAMPALDAQTRMMLGGRFRLGFWKTPKERMQYHSTI